MLRFILVTALLIVCVVLQYRLWMGDYGVRHYFQISHQVSQQKQSRDALIARNDRLKAEVVDLKNGQAAIEEHARNNLNMIKPDETFFRIVD